MTLGPSNPTWRRLSDVLAKLAMETDGALAFVVDEGNGLWCTATGTQTTERSYDEIADRFYRDVIAPRAQELRRGSRIEAVKLEAGNEGAGRLRG